MGILPGYIISNSCTAMAPLHVCSTFVLRNRASKNQKIKLWQTDYYLQIQIEGGINPLHDFFSPNKESAVHHTNVWHDDVSNNERKWWKLPECDVIFVHKISICAINLCNISIYFSSARIFTAGEANLTWNKGVYHFLKNAKYKRKYTPNTVFFLISQMPPNRKNKHSSS